MRQPRIEPRSIAWKATMLTFTPPTLLTKVYFAAKSFYFFWADDEILYNNTCYFWKLKFSIIETYASAGKRTRIYCLEGSNAKFYTTDAVNIALLCSREFLFFRDRWWNSIQYHHSILWKLKCSIIKISASSGSIAWKANNANLYTTDAVNTGFTLQQKVLFFSGPMMKFYTIPPLDTFENSNFLL